MVFVIYHLFGQKKLRVTFIKEKFGVTFDNMDLGDILGQLSNNHIVTWNGFMMENFPALFIKLFSAVPTFQLVVLYRLQKFSSINHPFIASRHCLFAFS
jgi:hypothetical protein